MRHELNGTSTEFPRSVRDHLGEVVDLVEHQHERVIVTRNGQATAVLISPRDLAQLEGTNDVLSDPSALADIRDEDAAYVRRDVVRGVAAVRRLRVTTRDPYELVHTPPDKNRAIPDELPEAVAAVDFHTAALTADLDRAAKPLRDDLAESGPPAEARSRSVPHQRRRR